jgi:hypothetical protein
MPHYFLKLNPRRPTFAQDMTAKERAVMLQHVAYWTDLMHKGLVVVFGPVMDPKQVYGMGVVEVPGEEQLKELIKSDPATGINNYEYYPMRAVVAAK